MGAPLGNQNAANAKRWAAACERAFAAWPNKPNTTDCTPFMVGLNEAAHEFVKGVMTKNDIAFFREVGDRFDGKAAQSVSVTAELRKSSDISDEELALIANASGAAT